jgi:hypothetical protein
MPFEAHAARHHIPKQRHRVALLHELAIWRPERDGIGELAL